MFLISLPKSLPYSVLQYHTPFPHILQYCLTSNLVTLGTITFPAVLLTIVPTAQKERE